MKRIGRLLVFGTVGMVVATGGFAPVSASATAGRGRSAGPACVPTWRGVPSPNVGSGDNQLGAVDAISTSDAWAVGNSLSGDTRSTLIEHWDGSRWSVVASPNGAEPVNWLTGVSAVAPDDVWAVGFTNDGNGSQGRSFTLTLHFDGTSWAVVRSPNPRPDPNPGHTPASNELYAVRAIAPNDVWAVGHTFTFSVEQTLALHWDGTRWSSVHTPHHSQFSRLRSVDASSGTDVWAVGEIERRGKQRTLTQHFDGVSWTTAPSPNEGITVDYVVDVSVAAPDDVWAVGYHVAVIGVDQPYQTSSWHFDGSAWALVDAPDVNQENNYLRSVVAVPGRGVFAVGFWDTGTALRTLAEQWTGSGWTIVSTPNRSDVIDELWAVDADANGIWAVGDYFGGFSFRTEIQRLGC